VADPSSSNVICHPISTVRRAKGECVKVGKLGSCVAWGREGSG
jgi:hypothetical protein